MDGRVAWIQIAPVKALALVSLDEARLERSGVPGDRRFHLVEEDGRLANAKRVPRLVQVVPAWDEGSQELTLTFPDGKVVSGRVALGEALDTVFYGRPVRGRAVRGAWADALSEFADRPLRVVCPDRPNAAVDRGAQAGVTMVSTAALDELAGHAGVDGRVDGRRFRMLLGVDGVTAHAEDRWIGRPIAVGEATVVPRGHVGRCAVTTRDPDTGAPDLDTLRILGRYRGDVASTEPLPFGVYGEVVEPGRVRVGDPVALRG